MKHDTLNELVTQKLYTLLESAKKVDFKAEFADDAEKLGVFSGVSLYLVDETVKNELLLLEAAAGHSEKQNRSAFWGYAKLINRDFPAYKYNFLTKKRSKQVFDREKVRSRLAGEAARYVNKERAALKKKLSAYDPPLSAEETAYLVGNLETRLEFEKGRIDEVLENFDAYDVVITNHAHSSEYPAIYYTMRTDMKTGYLKQDNTHLRLDVPNILWHIGDVPYKEYRANMKIEEIIDTFTAFCGTIYIKKR